MSSAPDPLPHASIAMVMGLLEHLREAPAGREDLYKLGGPLGYELDDLLPVTEAAKRLGLVRVAAGDIELTEAGRALAEAEASERPGRFRACLAGVALIDAIRGALGAGGGRASKEMFMRRLREQFSPSEAERQIATALNWARFGEVFDFDPDADEFVGRG
jgi:NitT/TauT family transport system ATP-binding protein